VALQDHPREFAKEVFRAYLSLPRADQDLIEVPGLVDFVAEVEGIRNGQVTPVPNASPDNLRNFKKSAKENAYFKLMLKIRENRQPRSPNVIALDDFRKKKRRA